MSTLEDVAHRIWNIFKGVDRVDPNSPDPVHDTLIDGAYSIACYEGQAATQSTAWVWSGDIAVLETVYRWKRLAARYADFKSTIHLDRMRMRTLMTRRLFERTHPSPHPHQLAIKSKKNENHIKARSPEQLNSSFKPLHFTPFITDVNSHIYPSTQ